MKKNMIAGFLSVAMLATAGLSAFAATPTDPVTLPAAVEGEAPSTIEATHIDAFLKKYGLDKKEKGELTSKDFHKDFANFYFSEKELEEIATMSKAIELRGWTDETSTTLYTVKKAHKSGDYNYEVVYALFMDIRTGLVNAAAIKRLPSNENDKAASIYPMDKAALADIEKDALAYAKANIFLPTSKIAQRSVIYGYKVETAANKGLRDFWAGRGWTTSNWTFYQNAYEEGRTAYLTAEEINQAMKVSGEATGGVQVAMIMPSTGFYFTERNYRIKDTENRFFIDFVASGIDPTADKDKLGANFAFLIVKPAKVNQDGTLDKYFYPTDAKMSTIVRDMTKIFNESNSVPEGAVN